MNGLLVLVLLQQLFICADTIPLRIIAEAEEALFVMAEVSHKVFADVVIDHVLRGFDFGKCTLVCVIAGHAAAPSLSWFAASNQTFCKVRSSLAKSSTDETK